MTTALRSAATSLPLVIMALVLVGCPKRPAATIASAPARATAPASVGAGATPAAQPVPSVAAGAAPSRGGMAAGASRVPPRPSEFRATEMLKDIHFDFDRYDIRPSEDRILDANLRWLRLHSEVLVLIEGHCDERGTNEYNLSLGERRAKTIATYMIAHGVRAERISTISYGEERPACTSADEACWARNRRAHFLVKER